MTAPVTSGPAPADRSETATGATGPAPPSIEATDLAWTYAGRGKPALDGLDFRLEPGRVLLVLGPSGCGKSTLTRALAGLVPHVLRGEWRGSLQIGGLEVAETPARLLGERVGLVFQDPDSQLVMAHADDEVAFGLENRGWPREAMTARVPEALAEVGLGGFERRGTATLSGGEKQRLAIADVLAPTPGLLVFDEPTANLDPPGMHATIERLGQLAARRRHTIVLVEHRLEAALPLADDVLLLDGAGRQIAFAPAASIGRDAAELLDRSGAWVPRAWRGRADADARRDADPLRPRPQAHGDVHPVVAVQAEGVELAYPTDASGRHPALEEVSFVARAGERVGLVGPNGAGKSSLLLLLAGLRRPDRGSVRIAARGGTARSSVAGADLADPSRLRPAELAARIGLVFQDPELGFVARTVRDEVLATPRSMRSGRPAPADEAAADNVLARFGLADLRDVEPFRLSQGEQRRLSLVALAIAPPAVLLLDEPTFGLDRRGTEAVIGLLDDLRAVGQAQILATHDPRLLPGCDRVVALDGGRVVFDGLPVAFLAEPPYEPPEPWREGPLATATLDAAVGSGAGS